jgi:type IV pilus assembly protein PilY1
MKKSKSLILATLLVLSTLMLRPASAVEPTISEYTSYPIFQLTAVAPNILIMLDNSTSMNSAAYRDTYDHGKTYYGYFEPHKKYSYGSNVFVRNDSGSWDGNFLNWLSMRRIDIARKVLMGGLATSRQGTGNQTNIGETPQIGGYDFTKKFKDLDGSSVPSVSVTPFDSTSELSYVVDDGNFYVNGQTFVIRVDKNMNLYPDEAPGFLDGNIAGVLQKIGGKARWGNEFFNFGTGRGQSGGRIVSTIGTNIPSLITDLQNTACDTWTPLAEAYYVAMQYFKQEPPQSGLDYPNSAVPCSNIGQDPFYNGTEYVSCAKSFVILLTDGGSTMDQMVPNDLKEYDSATKTLSGFTDSGSHYLDDIALYARTNDLRQDLDGDQNLILYTIYAFGDEDASKNAMAESLLKNAAKNGGFVDKNGTNRPDLPEEYDANGDNDPDTYYRAEDGYQLESTLLAAVNDILRRAASGTAVSVLAASGEGEANMVQAYYVPNVPSGYTDIKWVGFLQSIWVDPDGNLREDTDGDWALDLTKDNVITYYTDPSNGDTRVKKFHVSSTNLFPDTSANPDETAALNQVSALWEAGKNLWLRSAAGRRIFTFIDKNANGVVDEPLVGFFDTNGEAVSFEEASAPALKPYFGVRDDTAWRYLGANWDTRVTNLINYIRGTDITGLRSRTIDGQVWKLGDIVQSTPVSISKPPDNFHIIYSDESYQFFYDAFKNRETVVYVGANDGMLHAFTSWKYDATSHQYSKPEGAGTSEAIGDELWAYIPQSLLPHLKWLPDPNYTHVFYVDLKPKVFDAKILPDDTHYTDDGDEDNWGTFVLVGLNMGGKQISATGDFDYSGTVGSTESRTFTPSFALLDVTEPRNPRLMWEKTFAGLGMTTSVPAIVRVKDQWFAVFGSGPTNYDGSSSQRAHVFVVDLKTGAPYKSASNDWLFETAESSAFMNSPVSLDVDLNYNVDAVYFGETYLQGGTWQGKVYKVAVPAVNAAGQYDSVSTSTYPDNPLDSNNPWRFWPLFNATKPVTTSVLLSQDGSGNVWLYGGTGRYLSTEDKINTDTQYIFGIKDPFFNKAHTPTGAFADNYYHNYTAGLQLQITDLFNGDSFVVLDDGSVYEEDGSLFGFWKDLLVTARAEDGWIRTLTISKERVLNKPSILAGIVFTPSFIPNGDICGAGGESYLYAFHYETGTAYYKPAFSTRTEIVALQGVEMMKTVERLYLGLGKASSLGIHVGLEQGATGFVQQSTGNILTEPLNPALFVKSGLRSWQER